MKNVLLIFLLLFTGQVMAEIYVYVGPDGQKLISDKVLNRPGFRLQHQQGSLKDVGHIAAGREDMLQHSSTKYFDHYIRRAGERYDIDPALLKAIIRVESNFDPGAISSKGARGLMQLMPSTAAMYEEYDLFSPVANISVGTRHFSYLMQLYSRNTRLALAAYNAGEGNVRRHNGIPPFQETRRYVKKVLHHYNNYRQYF